MNQTDLSRHSQNPNLRTYPTPHKKIEIAMILRKSLSFLFFGAKVTKFSCNTKTFINNSIM